MKTGNTSSFKNAHLKKWLEITRTYLFSDRERLTDMTEEMPEPGLDSHGAQNRYISRVRGSVLRLMKRTAAHDRNPLLELERAFHLQASFISRHPEIPRRLLGWLSQDSDTRIRRRIQRVIGHYESRLCRIIAQARQQGCIRPDIDPRAAAGIFIGMIQSLALRMNVSLRQRELLLHEAFQSFFLFRTGMTVPSK